MPSRTTQRAASRRTMVAGLAIAFIAGAVGCFHRIPEGPRSADPIERIATPQAINALPLFRKAGFVTSTGFPGFAGTVRYLAGPSADSTLVLVGFSFPNRELSFTSDGEQYRAAYDVTYDVRSGPRLVLHRAGRAEVRVSSFRETTRDDESVIAQQVLTLSPGAYTLDVTVRDAGSSGEGGHAKTQLVVPNVGQASFLSPVTVYQSSVRSDRTQSFRAILNPRNSVLIGRDSALLVYVEAYGPGAPSKVDVRVIADGAVLYRDSASLESAASFKAGVLALPTNKIGLGLMRLAISNYSSPGVPLADLPIVVRPGEDLALGSFGETAGYLRFFTTPARLHALQDSTSPSAREEAWAALVNRPERLRGDTSRALPTLTDFLARVQAANQRYRQHDLPGWVTDRGRVYATIGAPDSVVEPIGSAAMNPGAKLLWLYKKPAIRLTFIDQSGEGDFVLSTESADEFAALFRRLTACPDC